MRKIFKMAKTTPQNLQSDAGKEFTGRLFQNLLKEHDVNFFTTHSEQKASVVERFIRTLKNSLYKYFTYKGSYKYIDVLQNFLKAYNQTPHSAIKAPPNAVNPSNQYYFWRTFHSPLNIYAGMKPKKYSFKVGDTVRISKARHVFARGFKSGWSKELFTVARRYPSKPVVTYTLQDLKGDLISGRFYPYELQLTIKPADAFHAVEKIVKTRGKGAKKEYLVRWEDYDRRFDTWILAKDLRYTPPN